MTFSIIDAEGIPRDPFSGKINGDPSIREENPSKGRPHLKESLKGQLDEPLGQSITHFKAGWFGFDAF